MRYNLNYIIITFAVFPFLISSNPLSSSPLNFKEQYKNNINSISSNQVGEDYSNSFKYAPFLQAEKNNFDNSINESIYFIGGGDRFIIISNVTTNVTYKGTIDQNCNLYIPEIGIIEVGKKNLSEAKIIIQSFFKNFFKNKTLVYITLEQSKNVTININGNIELPGTYSFQGTMKILDAIKYANNGQIPSLQNCDFRTLRVSSHDSICDYDLLKYLLNGDVTQNPYVYPGDNLMLGPTTKRVQLIGPIKSIISGNIPIKDNETFKDFISMFKFDASADTENIILQKTIAQGNEQTFYALKDNGNIILQDRDVIIVPHKKEYPEILTVSVTGEIKIPGTYSIIKDHILARDILLRAGDFTEYANRDNVVIIRRGKTVTNVIKNQIGLNSLRPELNTSFSMMGQLNDFSVIPFKDNDKIILENDDQIFVPKKEKYVYISGEVKAPGGYEYLEGKDKTYYINLAGGYGKKADKVNVYSITRYGDIIQKKDASCICQGDLIVVPLSQQNKTFLTVFLPALQAIATTISVVLAIYATAKND